MKHSISNTWLDRWFEVILVLKGLNGLAELVGGTFLLVVSSANVQDYLTRLSLINLVENSAFLTKEVASLSHTFTSGTQTYTAVYLLLHGVLKVGLVIALLSKRYYFYPYAIGVLILFMIYQIYRIIFEHQIVFDTTLTVIDGIVVWLTIIEYRRHMGKLRLPRF